MKNGVNAGGVGIWLDEIVPCLKDTETGEIKETVVFRIESRSFLEKFNEKNGWEINWIKIPKEVEVFALALKENNEIQGLVGVRNDVDVKAAYLHWACTAPQNNKHAFGKQKYIGVGGHLFAIAADRSLAWGYDGFIHGFALNKELLNHYIEVVGTRSIPMSGIRKPAVILADSMEEYLAPPNPYKNPPKGKLNLLELGRYAERVGKDFDELTADEILQFKIP